MTQSRASSDELWAAFAELAAGPIGSDEGSAFPAVRVSGQIGVHLAKDEFGAPLLLVQVSDHQGARAVELPQLRVSHGLPVTLITPDGARSSVTCSVLCCRAREDGLRRLFIDCLSTLLPAAVEARSARWLSSLVTSLVELFAAAQRSGTLQVSGLWAELLVVAAARDSIRMARAWHNELDERFDFAEGPDRLEVKATRTAERRHSFSHAQANPAAGVSAIVVSVITEPASQGVTVGVLREQCMARLHDHVDLAAKIDRLCAEYLGIGWLDGMSTAFDYERAIDSFALFDMSAIPRIAGPLPDGVVDAHFTSLVSLARPLTPGSVLPSGLGALIFPLDSERLNRIRHADGSNPNG